MKNAFDKGKPISEAGTRQNVFLLCGLPRAPGFTGDTSCLLSIFYDDEKGAARVTTLKRMMPEIWEGRYTPQFSKVDGEVTEEYGYTHVALIEGPADLGVKFQKDVYFVDGRVEGPFIIVSFNEHTQEYINLHCTDCAYGIAQWFIDNQDFWKHKHGLSKGDYGPAPATKARH